MSRPRYLREFEIKYIQENHSFFTAKQIAKAVGCTDTAVRIHCKKMGFKCLKSALKSVFSVPPCVEPACTIIIPAAKKFDSEMTWDEYRDHYMPTVAHLGNTEAWEHYHRMRWGSIHKLWDYEKANDAYNQIPAENNPGRFYHY